MCAWLLFAPLTRAQSREDEGREEAFERIDPYTKGESRALDRLGYVSFGPFPLAQGIKTSDVEETLGVTRVLWVETAHFKLGSTLRSYKLRGDSREEKKLKLELERLLARMDKPTPPQGKLDPWLRLHLFAQRLEEQYADFCTRFGVKDADFAEPSSNRGSAANAKPRPGEPGYMGEGPYLGQVMKFTVLLTEKSSSMARFASHWIKHAGSDSFRDCLPGGSMFLGTAAQTWKDYGYDLDATLQCVVADDLAHNLLDGFRNAWFAVPVWFKEGLAYFYAREADQRFPVYAKGALRNLGDDSWKWEPRLHGLVQNQIALSWKDMMAWQSRTDIRPQEHMIAWSRVAWLLSQKNADLHAYLMGITDSALAVPEADRSRVRVEKETKALAAAFAKTPEDLDQAWRRYVLATYAKK
jgi:hypothetical protein